MYQNNSIAVNETITRVSIASLIKLASIHIMVVLLKGGFTTTNHFKRCKFSRS